MTGPNYRLITILNFIIAAFRSTHFFHIHDKMLISKILLYQNLAGHQMIHHSGEVVCNPGRHKMGWRLEGGIGGGNITVLSSLMVPFSDFNLALMRLNKAIISTHGVRTLRLRAMMN